MNYEEMSDFEINKRVAELRKIDFSQDGSEVYINVFDEHHGDFFPEPVDYCNNPADAWPIIIENKMTVQSPANGILNLSKEEWDVSASCYIGEDCMCFSYLNKNPLRAAMIVYLMMREAE